MAKPPRRSPSGRLLPCLYALLLLVLALSMVFLIVEAVPPRLDAFAGEDLDSRPSSSPDAATPVTAAAMERKTPLDDLTAFWLENADELKARDERMSPEDRALELARRETEWRNAARRKEQAERMEKGGEEEKEEGEKKSVKEMERERKRFKEEERGKDSSTEEGSLDPSSNVIDAATLYSPPKATAFKAQGDAPAKISLGKMLTEGKFGEGLLFCFRESSEVETQNNSFSSFLFSLLSLILLSLFSPHSSRLRPQGRRPRHHPRSRPRRGRPPAHGP